jgi:hypothetical protein
MQCNTSNLSVRLKTCAESILLKADLTPGETYSWFIENKFGTVRAGNSIADVEGSILIPLTGFPDGTFNQHAGSFYLRLRNELSQQVSFIVGDSVYNQIVMNFTEYTGMDEEFTVIDFEDIVTSTTAHASIQFTLNEITILKQIIAAYTS